MHHPRPQRLKQQGTGARMLMANASSSLISGEIARWCKLAHPPTLTRITTIDNLTLDTKLLLQFTSWKTLSSYYARKQHSQVTDVSIICSKRESFLVRWPGFIPINKYPCRTMYNICFGYNMVLQYIQLSTGTRNTLSIADILSTIQQSEGLSTWSDFSFNRWMMLLRSVHQSVPDLWRVNDMCRTVLWRTDQLTGVNKP